jgi:hypothetical protein
MLERKREVLKKKQEPSQKERVLQRAQSAAAQKKEQLGRNMSSLLQATEAHTHRILSKEDSISWGLAESGRRATPSWRSGV